MFASANTSNMDAVVEAGAADDPEVFVTNQLEIVVPGGQPGRSHRPRRLRRRRPAHRPVRRGGPVRRVRARGARQRRRRPRRSTPTSPTSGRCSPRSRPATSTPASCTSPTSESAGDTVEGIEIPADDNVIATYPIAALGRGRATPDVADAFVDFVLSDEGQAILAVLRVRRPVTSSAPGREAAHGGSAPRGARAARGARPSRSSPCPFVALLQRAPWGDLGELAPPAGRHRRPPAEPHHAPSRRPGIALVLGIPLAWVLARTPLPGPVAGRGRS